MDNKIAGFRKEKGLTQEELAKMANISRPHLSQLEKNKYYPQLRTLNKIAKALDCSINNLYG